MRNTTLSAAVILFGYSISTVIRCHAAELDSPAVQTLKAWRRRRNPKQTTALPLRQFRIGSLRKKRLVVVQKAISNVPTALKNRATEPNVEL